MLSSPLIPNEWTKTDAPELIYKNIVYGNGVFMAMDDSGAGATSTDGVNWTTRSDFPKASTSGNDVFFANGQFIVWTSYASGRQWIHTSEDTNSWTTITTTGTEYANYPQDLVYFKGAYYMVAQKRLFKSIDLAIWEQISISFTLGGSYDRLIASTECMVLVAWNGKNVYWSDDGTTWNQTNINTTSVLPSVAVKGELFAVILGNNSARGFKDNWISGPASELPNISVQRALSATEDFFIAAGTSGRVLISYDGLDWQELARISYSISTGVTTISPSVFCLNNVALYASCAEGVYCSLI